MKNSFVIFLLLLLVFPHLGSAQDLSGNEPGFEVNRIHPYISITRDALTAARTLSDLNEHYKPSWIREYITVEILTTYKGQLRKAVSNQETLSQEQKDHMNTADVGTDISVKVRYIPDNTLKQNNPKELHFTFSVDPDNEATYPGGKQQLNAYLKEQAIDRIPANTFRDYDLTAVKFAIDEEGHVMDAHIFWSSEDEKTNRLLLETICNMPNWKPATYVDGTKVRQEFVWTVGSMENCMINLLNIRRD